MSAENDLFVSCSVRPMFTSGLVLCGVRFLVVNINYYGKIRQFSLAVDAPE